ncbi:hypothetical protein M427DRAFT_325873 [Gonapodya prolifera JEL478]|uniref:Uncharacterized protein n=1 Tax=Gonapodya prolifera (strain JEL478) TaxID=1344416 RepID=A0A139AGE3_GONPJ|nr:hypothetical protein M427DRAFT_325873 [Gonapodya prolifera JEL478]|eukprot:KXS15483.1 hypothetical protein M427DRAFT_325873 [Gonapodya prolifera JEL478]
MAVPPYSMMYVPPSAEAPEPTLAPPHTSDESAVPTPSPSMSSFSALIDDYRDTAGASSAAAMTNGDAASSIADNESEADGDSSSGRSGADVAWWLAKARGSALPRPRKLGEPVDERRRISAPSIPSMSPRVPPPPPSRKAPSRIGAPTTTFSNGAHPHAPSVPNSNPPRPQPPHGLRRQPTHPITQLQSRQTPYRPASVVEPMSISNTPVNRDLRLYIPETPDTIGAAHPSTFAARLQNAGGPRNFGAPTTTPVSMLVRDMGRLGLDSPMQLDGTPTKG